MKDRFSPAVRFFSNVIPLALTIVLLALSPFAAALEVHHALAAADHDGHEHSDSDLCQWVQHHTANSLADGVPLDLSWLNPRPHKFLVLKLQFSGSFVLFVPSRAPPIS